MTSYLCSNDSQVGNRWLSKQTNKQTKKTFLWKSSVTGLNMSEKAVKKQKQQQKVKDLQNSCRTIAQDQKTKGEMFPPCCVTMFFTFFFFTSIKHLRTEEEKKWWFWNHHIKLTAWLHINAEFISDDIRLHRWVAWVTLHICEVTIFLAWLCCAFHKIVLHNITSVIFYKSSH